MAPVLPRGLYGIADTAFRRDLPLLDKIQAFISAGVGIVQVRAKGDSGRQILASTRQAVALGRQAGIRVVLNDRPDLAKLAQADGVHLGHEDLPVGEVRAWLGPDFLIGATVRTLDEARAAAAAGADYVGFGPIFGTTTKSVGVAPRGLAMLAEVVRGSPIPVIAIGGIDLDRIGSVAATGVAGAAVVSAVLGAADPIAAARDLSARFAAGAPA
jgi:thiamine-phosphate pyrophosphorylase